MERAPLLPPLIISRGADGKPTAQSLVAEMPPVVVAVVAAVMVLQLRPALRRLKVGSRALQRRRVPKANESTAVSQLTMQAAARDEEGLGWPDEVARLVCFHGHFATLFCSRPAGHTYGG